MTLSELFQASPVSPEVSKKPLAFCTEIVLLHTVLHKCTGPHALPGVRPALLKHIGDDNSSGISRSNDVIVIVIAVLMSEITVLFCSDCTVSGYNNYNETVSSACHTWTMCDKSWHVVG